MTKEMVLLELFSGIGGFTKGFMDAGYTIKKHYFSEIDKHAIANYKHNFKDAEYVGSVTDVHGGAITRPNVITFGSPCQDFSLAGKRKGMEGERSSLILHAIRLIRECKPDIFIWENVKGAFSSNSGADFWGIIQAFANIRGYRLEWQLINGVWFLPQNRERIYLVGHLNGRSRPGVFPIGEELSRTNEGAKQTRNIRTLTAGGHSGGMHSSMTLIRAAQRGREAQCLTPKRTEYGKEVRKDYESGKVKEQRKNIQQLEPRQDGVTNTLTGVQKDNLIIQVNPSTESGGKQPYQQNRVYDSEGVVPALMKDKSDLIIGDFRSDEGFRERKDGFCPTIQARAREDGSGQPQLKIGTSIRRLTEIECERLQGFPDNWTEYGNYDGVTKKIPKTQRYKMCGNAVMVDCVRAIAERIEIT